MTYASYETSVHSGEPVEVFEIVAGPVTYYYTSAPTSQTIGAQTYTPVDGLRRGNTAEGPELRTHDFTLELPTSNPVASFFTGTLPGYRVRLTVKRFHAADLPTPEVVQSFDGFIQSASFLDGGFVTSLVARPILSALGTTIPRRTYQSSCNHILYDPDTCKVDDTDPAFRASALSVASQVGATLTVSSGLSGFYSDGFMQSGFVEVVGGSDYRMINTHVGNVLTLLVPFATTPLSVNVYAGCGHAIADCETDFDNVINFGGFAFVPKRNPVADGIV